MSGLTLVSVPIGNVGDITLRAKQKLQDCSVIVAEDTRVLKDLLKRLDIDFGDKNIISYHDHSGENAAQGLAALMEKGEVVYVSDAGSPVVSDPALPLVALALEKGFEVESLPGPSSILIALELSGLPATPFHFHGFPGREKSKIAELEELISSQYGTHIFFEGVSRVKKTMGILCSLRPQWKFVLCRELTKTFQSVHRFAGSDWERVKGQIVEKGEFVVLAHNPEKKAGASKEAERLARQILKDGARPKLLAKLLSELTGIPSKEVYSGLKR